MEHDSYLWIQQYREDGNTEEIIQVTAGNGSEDDVRRAFERIKRMPFKTDLDPFTVGHVWIEMVLDGKGVQDGGLIVEPGNARWLLGSVMNIKRGWKGKLKG